MTKIICGVDVSSKRLDASIGRDGPFASFERDAEGIARLAAFCKEHRVDLVAMEATGGYEKLPFALLWAEGLASAIVNARAVRDFARAMGFLEKTDRIDAGMIAAFAETRRIAAAEPQSPDQQRLAALVGRLRQLVDLSVMQKNQRRLVADAMVLGSFGDLLALVAAQVRRLETEIATLIGADPVWRAIDAACRSIKGVADRTVGAVTAWLPELGTISNKAISKLAGLAPLANDSGGRSGRRAVRGGRAGIRAILFVVAEVVRRHEPDFAAFHERLGKAGKAKKAIRVALAHKLLVRLNAKARDARKALAAAA